MALSRFFCCTNIFMQPYFILYVMGNAQQIMKNRKERNLYGIQAPLKIEPMPQSICC